MYGLKRVLGVVLARGGSKGVPGKNLRLLQGRPLIAHTIDVAIASERIDRVVMSTDCPDIAATAEQCGADVPFLRPAALSTDASPALAAIKHAVRWLAGRESDRYDAVVTLQPTVPCRTPEDVDAAIGCFFDEDADMVLGVGPVAHSPYWMFTTCEGFLRPLLEPPGDITSRQSLPPVYRANGYIYVNRSEHLLDPTTPDTVPLWELGQGAIPFVIDDPLANVDLDTEVDFAVLELLLARRVGVGVGVA